MCNIQDEKIVRLLISVICVIIPNIWRKSSTFKIYFENFLGVSVNEAGVFNFWKVKFTLRAFLIK